MRPSQILKKLLLDPNTLVVPDAFDGLSGSNNSPEHCHQPGKPFSRSWGRSGICSLRGDPRGGPNPGQRDSGSAQYRSRTELQLPPVLSAGLHRSRNCKGKPAHPSHRRHPIRYADGIDKYPQKLSAPERRFSPSPTPDTTGMTGDHLVSSNSVV